MVSTNDYSIFPLPEDDRLAIQSLSLGNEMKNWEPFVFSSTFAVDRKATGILQDEVLILRFPPLDGLAAKANMACDVTTLAHEYWSNSVTAATLRTKSFLSSAPNTKVSWYLWNLVCKHLKRDTTQGVLASALKVKE